MICGNLQTEIKQLQEQLIRHPIYSNITTVPRLIIFMEHHVYAVWDFMSLVKKLQQEFTNISIPWTPPEDIESARLINEIVLDEETDVRKDGSYVSHYELYLEAMSEIGADTNSICSFVQKIRFGISMQDAFVQVGIAKPIQKFVNATFDVVGNPKKHILASAFLHSRESIIPDMFRPLLHSMSQSNLSCEKFVYYLDRHVELDGDKHSVWANKLIDRLSIGNEELANEVEQTTIKVLEARVDFWDYINSLIEQI